MNLISLFRRTWIAIRRRPGLHMAMLLCLALGMAATSAVVTLFSVASLKSLPFPEADRLVRLWFSEPGGEERIDFSYAEVPDLREGLGALERLELAGRARLVSWDDGGGRRIEGEAISEGYFSLLGASASQGRLLLPSDFEADAEPALVLSFRSWVNHFGADPDIVGETFYSWNQNYTIIGVATAGFGGSIEEDNGDIEFWVPQTHYATPEQRADRRNRNVWVIGRMADAQGLVALRQQAQQLGERLLAAHPDVRRDQVLMAEPLGENWRASLRPASWILNGAAGALLLLALLNVAGLMVARTVERRRELAVRSAVGASRAALVGQLIAESALLIVVAGSLGIVIGPALLSLFLAFTPNALPDYMQVSLNMQVTLLSFAVLAIGAMVAALIPALIGSRDAARLDLHSRAIGGAGGERRISMFLVSAEVALALVLAVGSVMLLRSQFNLQSAELGFEPDGLVRTALFASPQDRPEDQEQLLPYFLDLSDRLRQGPEFSEVAQLWPTTPYLAPSPAMTEITHGALARANDEARLRVGFYTVDDRALDVLRIPLVAGRNVSRLDIENGNNVTVVSKGLADQLGGVNAAIGSAVTALEQEFTIVGVAQDVQLAGPREGPGHRFELYLPLHARVSPLMTFLVRGNGAEETLIPNLQRRFADLAPSSALDWTDTINDALASVEGEARFLAALVSGFALLALIITAVGLGGLLADRVARDAPRFAIMQALGATPRTVMAFVLGGGGRALLLGAVLGVVGVMLLGRLLGSVLFGVGAFDPISLIAAIVVLALVALLASLLPAIRASRIEPMQALRAE